MKEVNNEVECEGIALQMARHYAIRMLGEIVGKINIDAVATYQKYQSKDDLLKAETAAELQYTHPIHEEFRWTEGGAPRAEVTVRYPIRGGLSKISAKWAMRELKKHKEQVQFPRYKALKQTAEKYTGLIIDACGIGVKPVLHPKILTSDGTREVYGTRSVKIEDLSLKGATGYTNSIEKAKSSKRVGLNPLIVKAQRAEGAMAGNVIISENDAKKVVSADIESKFLESCDVVIVVD